MPKSKPRDYPIGTIADITIRDDAASRVTKDKTFRAVRHPNCWVDILDSDWFYRDDDKPSPVVEVRPMFVVEIDGDPEKFVADLEEAAGAAGASAGGDIMDSIARQIRQQLPLKFEEPTGLGAVVKATTKSGSWSGTFVRAVASRGAKNNVWTSPLGNYTWESLDVEAILSTGVEGLS